MRLPFVGMQLSVVVTLLILSIKATVVLQENEIYQWWSTGQHAQTFQLFTGQNTEKLFIYATDLRSSHADGHGASAEAQAYFPNETITINYVAPDIGDGFLSVVATFSHAIKLISGIPQHIILAGSTDFALFQFETSADTKLLTISLTPFQGKPVAYISNSSIPIIADDPSTYQHKIYSHFSILEGDTRTYYILTKNDVDSPRSRFYVTVSTYDTNILLQSGVPRLDDIDYTTTAPDRYYYFNVTEPNCTLAVLMTVSQGDPDLFVSMSNEHPDSADYDLISEHYGSDSILVRNASTAMYYIGVASADEDNVKYSISTMMQCSHEKYFTYLVDGQSQINVLGAKDWAYYKFEFDYNASISEILMQINPSSGDPDLYADLNMDIDINNASCTDPTTWRWNARQYGSDHLRVSKSDYFDICKSSNDSICTLDVAVFGWSETVYTIMVSSSNEQTVLQNGKPIIGAISSATEFAYFKFDLEDMSALLQQNNITISITPLVQSTSDNTIDTVFYVDGDANPHPDADHYRYKSDDAQHPFLIIDGQQLLHDDTLINELYIAVQSNQNLTYTIVLTVGTETQLQDGQTQFGHTHLNHPAFFELIIDNADKRDQDIEIIVNAMHGHINVYVDSKVVPDPNNASTYTFYRNETGMSIKRVLINNTRYHDEADSQCFNDLCRFYITVATPDYEEAEFTIVASTDTAVMSLLDGQPISSQINAQQYEFFSIEIDYDYKNHPVLYLEATPISGGNVDLYISKSDSNRRPNASHYDLASTDSGADAVTISDAAEGTYYIAVHAPEQQSIFSVTATLSNALSPGFVRLLSGVPASGVISSLHTSARFYQIYVAESATMLKLHAQHTIFAMTVYVSQNLSDGVPSVQNNFHHFRSGTYTIVNPSEGSYYIGVYSHVLCLYTLTATLSDDLLLLQEGQGISGQIAAKQYDYYQMQLHDASKDFSVSLTAFSGDPDLYIALNDATGSVRPTTDDNLWSSLHYGSDLITISHDDPKSCNDSSECTYIVGVFGYSASMYSITATSEDTIELQDGIPIRGELSTGQWNFFTFVVPNEPVSLVVGVTLISGQNDLFVDLGREPSATHYLYTVDSWNQDKSISFSHTSCGTAGTDFCTYYIGVRGVEQGQYSVYYQSGDTDSEFLLEDSIPVTRTVGADEFLYFRYQTSADLESLSISLTPIAGVPQCYISSLTERPSTEEHEFEITRGAQTVRIEPVASDVVYHLTLFAETESTFTLSAIGEHVNRSADATGIRLSEGVTLYGAVEEAGGWQYYSFSTSSSVSNDIIISVYALSGDPDIYCNTESYPTLSRYEFVADLDGPETLTVPNINGTYFCGIHADNAAATQFYIVAYHSHSVVTLLDDVPLIGELNAQNDVNYYHFIAESLREQTTDDVVSLILTPIYSTGCSMFVSSSTYRPSASDYEFAINDADTIVGDGLRGLDLKIRKDDLDAADDWYIAVAPLSVGGSALYTLLLSYDNVTTLQQGLPQNGQVGSYFVINFDLSPEERGQPLSVGVTLLSGACTIFLSRNPLMLNSCPEVLGCPSALVDYSRPCSDNSPLVIHSTDAYYLSEGRGTYYIAVTAGEVGVESDADLHQTYFDIVAYTANTILYLSNAIPTWDSIELDETRYYHLLCDEDAIIALDIVVTPVLADDAPAPFLLSALISTTRSRPTGDAQTGEFESEWVDEYGAVFSVSEDDAAFVRSSQYFISVRAVPNAEAGDEDTSDELVFTISAVASTRDSIEYRALIDNMPQMAIIHANSAVRYYSFKSATDAKSVRFTVQVAQGKLSVMISNNGQTPSLENYQYSLDDVGKLTDSQTLSIATNCAALLECSFLIAVFADSESVYSIMADTAEHGRAKSDGESGWWRYVVAVFVVLIIGVLSLIGGCNWKKNQRLKHELEVAELQLNMKGEKTMRQQQQELASTTSGPAQPFANAKKKGKKKYVGLADEADAEDDVHGMHAMLVDNEEKPDHVEQNVLDMNDFSIE